MGLLIRRVNLLRRVDLLSTVNLPSVNLLSVNLLSVHLLKCQLTQSADSGGGGGAPPKDGRDGDVRLVCQAQPRGGEAPGPNKIVAHVISQKMFMRSFFKKSIPAQIRQLIIY